jgi:sugar phosphate isomerase/epimerase
MKYGICLEMVFTDKPLLDRIQLAARAGFKYAEMWFIDGTFNGADCASDPKDPHAVAKAASDSGITIISRRRYWPFSFSRSAGAARGLQRRME